MFEITQEEVKHTVEKPDKIMECKVDGTYCYVRKIKGKAELLVITKQIESDLFDVICFGWLQSMFYPSL